MWAIAKAAVLYPPVQQILAASRSVARVAVYDAAGNSGVRANMHSQLPCHPALEHQPELHKHVNKDTCIIQVQWHGNSCMSHAMTKMCPRKHAASQLQLLRVSCRVFGHDSVTSTKPFNGLIAYSS